MRGGALITDGENRIALSILRSLTRRNIETAVVMDSQTALSSFSRYCRIKALCPSPSKDVKGFIATIRKLVEKEGVDCLFPVTDPALIAASEHRGVLGSCVKQSLPSHESVMKAFDKSLTLKA